MSAAGFIERPPILRRGRAAGGARSGVRRARPRASRVHLGELERISVRRAELQAEGATDQKEREVLGPMLEELTRWAKRLGFASAEAARSALANRMLAIREEQAARERKAAGRAAMPPEVAHGSLGARDRAQSGESRSRPGSGPGGPQASRGRGRRRGDPGGTRASGSGRRGGSRGGGIREGAAAGRVREAEAQGFLRIAREVRGSRFLLVLIPRLEAKATELLASP